MSVRFNEPITEKDLFALALDGRLKLSLRFGSSIAVRKVVTTDSGATGEWGTDYLSDDRLYYILDQEVTYVDGIFDLPLALGNKAVLRASEWGDGDMSVSFDEILLQNSENELVIPVKAKIDVVPELEGISFDDPRRFNFQYSLPSDCKWVVRTTEICNLEASLEKAKALELSSRERTNLLNIIGALLEELNQKETALIGALLLKHGEKPGIKERTLQQKFAEAKRSLLRG